MDKESMIIHLENLISLLQDKKSKDAKIKHLRSQGKDVMEATIAISMIMIIVAFFGHINSNAYIKTASFIFNKELSEVYIYNFCTMLMYMGTVILISGILYKQLFKRINLDRLKSLKRDIKDIENELDNNSIYNLLKDTEFIDIEVLKYFKKNLIAGRMDTLKECMNVYKRDKYMEALTNNH
ncbi:hypothetical protein JOC70_000960 [Clostridium pascui]|uniref:hypothetical protein n=1 Tax=Clostridium pascui TaxID=46609 RepID=UPI00195A8F62|nr:hypothetical protein [Clostridium pascui]MBM7869491.1 hypothetical protein [Clostridium pascui]